MFTTMPARNSVIQPFIQPSIIQSSNRRSVRPSVHSTNYPQSK
jgi:hypothetical protein